MYWRSIGSMFLGCSLMANAASVAAAEDGWVPIGKSKAKSKTVVVSKAQPTESVEPKALGGRTVDQVDQTLEAAERAMRAMSEAHRALLDYRNAKSQWEVIKRDGQVKADRHEERAVADPSPPIPAPAVLPTLTAPNRQVRQFDSMPPLPRLSAIERAAPLNADSIPARTQVLETRRLDLVDHVEAAPTNLDDGPPAYESLDDVLIPRRREPFRSDRAFPRFINPLSNIAYAKDPRSMTEIRAMFINNWVPSDHPLLPSDSAQVYAAQIHVALSERLTFIADKDGYAAIGRPGVATDGWLNVAAGLRYLLVRDVENQFLVSASTMYELQSGEASVFQSHGSGLLTLFGTVGKEFAEKYHFIGNVGHVFPVDRTQNSGFFYSSLHLDRAMFDWLYALVEFNWFHYTSGGNRGLPSLLGEGDGLLNLGTSGVTGNDLVTIAVGGKVMLSENLEVGIAWETPLSNRKDLIDNRILSEMILRY